MLWSHIWYPNEQDTNDSSKSNVDSDSNSKIYLGIKKKDLPAVIDWDIRGPELAGFRIQNSLRRQHLDFKIQRFK